MNGGAFGLALLALALVPPCLIALDSVSPVDAAESTTGVLVGEVLDNGDRPIVHARIAAASPSGSAQTQTDANGRFTILGLVPDTYTISAQAAGFESTSIVAVVLAGQTQRTVLALSRDLKVIGRVRARSGAFMIGSTSDTFSVSGETARAVSPPVSSSGLAQYTAGTVQGAIASVPGIDLDSFANAILRGGKVDDAVFDFDSVPLPQGLIAEPGGNVAGAQLPTTGIATTSVTLAGYQTQGDNSLGGVVDQIPAIGTFPAKASLEFADGVGNQYQYGNFQVRTASPDQRFRYALAATVGSEYLPFGDGHTFYPAEAATYGVSLQNRSQFSQTANVHFRATPNDDFSLVVLTGEANYDQYDTPYAGETYGALDGPLTTFPGETNPNAQVTSPSRVRGTYDVFKAQWVHTSGNSLARVQAYQSLFHSAAGGPFWDENGFPDGAISLSSVQGGREYGLGYDEDLIANSKHHIRAGVELRNNNSYLHQVVPTADEYVESSPTLNSYLVYFGDTYSASHRLDLSATARATATHVRPSFGAPYTDSALDPHFGASYRLGNLYALRATFDHTTVAPKPLEADRTDSTNLDGNGNPAPFVPLAPERSNDFTYAFEGGGKTQFRLTYFEKYESNRIDVLPFNFKTAISSGLNPSGVGVPTNAGELRAHGAELYLKNGGLAFTANVIRAFSSSASQFAYNDLNAPAAAAGHLFPLGYVPDFSSTLSYEYDVPGHHMRITPSASFHAGEPYGNGRKVYIFDPMTNKPEQVDNDNYVNPGANYYFLQDPSRPFNAATNPYIGNLGTPEGNDPNTLRSAAQIIANLHVEGDLSPRLTAVVDVANLFGNFKPTQYQVNPYLIGPPGYTGGNATYANCYGQILAGAVPCAPGLPAGTTPYTLGNGVPTNDGANQVVPWSYGTGGYIAQGYPEGRTVQVRLRYKL
jgi:hypothetical protein